MESTHQQHFRTPLEKPSLQYTTGQKGMKVPIGSQWSQTYPRHAGSWLGTIQQDSRGWKYPYENITISDTIQWQIPSTQFITFLDAQTYPEYCITFTAWQTDKLTGRTDSDIIYNLFELFSKTTLLFDIYILLMMLHTMNKNWIIKYLEMRSI